MTIPSRTRIPLIIIFRGWACSPPALTHRLSSSTSTYPLISSNHVLSRRRRPSLRSKIKSTSTTRMLFSVLPFLSPFSPRMGLCGLLMYISIAFPFFFFKHCFKAIFNPRVHPSPCICFHCIFIFAFSSPRPPFTSFLRTRLLCSLP
ncbi:hypothetical protein CPC08DRAFT_332699 [Agrocybe pediades]|nr:hypothetical protein CPC08DRAFT_332699 [Agrocybe pediades]